MFKAIYLLGCKCNRLGYTGTSDVFQPINSLESDSYWCFVRENWKKSVIFTAKEICTVDKSINYGNRRRKYNPLPNLESVLYQADHHVSGVDSRTTCKWQSSLHSTWQPVSSGVNDLAMQGSNLMTKIEQPVSLCVRSTEPHATGKAAYILTYNFFTEVGQLIRG
jgi:hypothetical protein